MDNDKSYHISYLRDSIRLVKQLKYPRKVINKLLLAKNDIQIGNILASVRHNIKDF